jgi:uncharacterized membrane protein
MHVQWHGFAVGSATILLGCYYLFLFFFFFFVAGFSFPRTSAEPKLKSTGQAASFRL